MILQSVLNGRINTVISMVSDVPLVTDLRVSIAGYIEVYVIEMTTASAIWVRAAIRTAGWPRQAALRSPGAVRADD